jgi:hypothetical protein
MRHTGAEIEGLTEDLVGVIGDQVDAGEWLRSLNEEAETHSSECLRFAVLEELFVLEGSLRFLGLEGSHDRVELGLENWVVFRKPAAEEDVLSSLNDAVSI